LEYQELVKEEASTVASRFHATHHPSSDTSTDTVYLNKVVNDMRQSLAKQGVFVSKTTCKTHVLKALANECFGISPQKPDGQALPTYSVKRIVDVVRALRERKMLVFPEEVQKWTTDAIEGTDYAHYFVDDKPTAWWYRGRLKILGFTTRVLRPLEQTPHEWFTEENLANYFEVAMDILLDVGVDVRNPDFDPNLPFSEKMCITYLERICSYDETKVELDCTKGGSGKRDHFVRGPEEARTMGRRW